MVSIDTNVNTENSLIGKVNVQVLTITTFGEAGKAERGEFENYP
jgi:hypothetical protein